MRTTAVPVLGMTGDELDALFASSGVTEIPVGRGRGIALVLPGTRLAPGVAWFTRLLFWRGKVFRRDTHDLLNLLTPFGVRAVRAEVRLEASITDGRPAVVLDYSATSRIVHFVRDEIREVGNDEYLGLVFLRGHQTPLRFFLDFGTATRT